MPNQRHTFLFAAMLLLPALLSAQRRNPQDTAVHRLFPKTAELQWVKYFSGRLDDVSDVDISLGFDGKNCKGYLVYTDSKTRLRLDGTLTDSTSLKLREFSPANEMSGYLRGTLLGKRLDAEWINHNNTLGSLLEAEEVPAGQIGLSHCGDNKWVSRYATTLASKRFEVVLSRGNNGLLVGSAWTEADNQTYLLRGAITENGSYLLDVKTHDGRPAGQMSGTMRFLQSFETNWQTPDRINQLFNFYLKESLSVGCNEYADFASSYDMLYPKTKCSACNTWLEKQVNAWVATCKEHFAAQKLPAKPANRASLRASGWADVSLWTDELFCGSLTFEESWNENPRSVSFNFDLKNGRDIAPNDLFIKNFDAKTWLAEYAGREAVKLAAWSQPNARAWLQKEGFPLLLLRRDGLAMQTSFHPVFGQQTILIPYATLKPYLQKDSPVAGFVK